MVEGETDLFEVGRERREVFGDVPIDVDHGMRQTIVDRG
jgi:hypothetical protein